MNKYLAILLALALTMGLMACTPENPYEKYAGILQMLEAQDYQGAIDAIGAMAGTPPQPEDPADSTTESSQAREMPGEEELELLNEYLSILQAFQSESVIFWTESDTVRGNAAMEYCYHRVLEMEQLDRWLQDEAYVAECSLVDPQVFCDRQTFLSRFTILEDVYMGYILTKEDNLGNIHRADYTGNVVYDPSGRLVKSVDSAIPRLEPETLIVYWDLEYFYDDAGRETSRKLYSGQNLQAIITYDLDDQGRIQTAHWKENRGQTEFVYTYDDLGNLTEISGRYNDQEQTFTYGYDEAGRRISLSYARDGRELCRETYTYDQAGDPVGYTARQVYGTPGILHLFDDNFGQHTYTLDEKGRILVDEIDPDDEGYQRYTLEYVYGDYYFYSGQ